MEKKSKMKKLLATASALAVLTGGSGVAFGANPGDGFSRPLANAVDFGAGANFNNNNLGVAAVFTDSNHFINARSNGGGGTANLSITAAHKNIKSLNVYGHNAATLLINIVGNNTLGSVYSNVSAEATAEVKGVNAANFAAGGAGAGAKLGLLTINDGMQLTLTGEGVTFGNTTIAAGTYDALGDITIGHANAVAATLIIDSDTTLAGSIDSDGANYKGVVTVAKGHNVELTGIIGGGNDLGALNIGDAGGSSTVTLKGASNIVAVNFEHADSKLVLDGKVLTGAFVNNVAAATGGILQLKNGTQVTGDIGTNVANKNIKLLDIDAGIARFDGNIHAKTLNFAKANSILLLKGGAAKAHKFEEVTLAGKDHGELHIEANDATIVSPGAGKTLSFGTEDKKMNKIHFVTDKTLILEDGVDVWAGSLTNAAATNGKIEFKGNNTFSAKNVLGSRIKSISVNNAGKVAKLMEEMSTNEDIVLAANATLEVAANLTTRNNLAAANNTGLIGAADGDGKVRFINSNAIQIGGGVGGAAGVGSKSLAAIEFAGTGDVTFSKTVNHKAGNAFTFEGDVGDIKVTFDNVTDVSKNIFTNNATDKTKTPTVVLTKNAIDFDNSIAANGDKDGHQINFQITGAGNKVSTNKSTGANFIGAGSDLALEFADTTINSVGAKGANLGTLTFTENATVTKDVYADTIDVKLGKIATIGAADASSNVAGTEFKLAGVGSAVVFKGNVTLGAAIVDTLGSKGAVTFEGGAVLDKDIGASGKAVSIVDFADDNKFAAELKADIHATTINLKKSTVALNSQVELNATDLNMAGTLVKLGTDFDLTATTTNVKGATLELGPNQLTTAKALAFDGKNTIKLSIGNDFKGGGIKVKNGGTLTFAKATTELEVFLSDTNSTPDIGTTVTYKVIDNDSSKVIAAADMLDEAKFTIHQGKGFTKWVKGVDANGNVIMSGTSNAEEKMLEKLTDDASETLKGNAAILAGAKLGTPAADFRDKIYQSESISSEKVTEGMARLSNPTAIKVADALEVSTAQVNTGMSTRMNSLAGTQRAGGSEVQSRVVTSEGISGVAAGDDHARFGAWFSPFYSQTVQKERKGAAGYKGDSYGASLGFDTKANDDMILGAAITVANSELKHRNVKSGDKTKISSLMFSIYGMHQITDAIYGHVSATFGSNEIRNTENRITLGANEKVQAKYNAMSFTGEAMFGYNHAIEMMTVTPMAGVRYSRVNAGGYKETGSTTGQNLTVSSRASNKFDVIVGARIAANTLNLNDVMVTPEAHAFIAHDLVGKNPKQSAIQEGAPVSYTAESKKPVNTTYNVGVAVNADYGMMEYGVGYDAMLGDKRVGHQGTLRLRVNF